MGNLSRIYTFSIGEGEYKVSVQLPSKDRENYFYDTIDFKVKNVNPEMKRDISYTPFGNEAGLAIDLNSSYIEEDGRFHCLKGKVGKLTDDDTIMVVLKKKFRNMGSSHSHSKQYICI